MPHHEFFIPITDIDAAGKAFDFVVRAAWIRGALEGCEATTSGRDGSLAVRVSRSGTDMVLRGRLRAELEVPCGRCLTPTKVNIDQDLSLLFVPAKELRKHETGELELSSADADTFPYSGETIVLDDVVRDELLLETPMIPLCSEDCAGIRPSPGGEVSSGQPQTDAGDASKIDPRLAPLLRFKQKSNLKE